MGSSTQADIRKLPTTKLQTILGINAAWTASEGSGVTLFRKQETGGWSCCAVAPSYSSFLDLADGHPVQWDAPGCFSDAGVDLNTLLPAAEKIAGARPTVVTVDMPLATSPIERRRKADDDISSAFGAMGCGAHTPNPARPGPLAERMRSASEGTGYGLAHVGTAPGTANRLLEVYPHPALLALLDEEYRIPYKVAKSGRLWKDANVPQRKANLLRSFTRILSRLQEQVADIRLPLPSPEGVRLGSTRQAQMLLDVIGRFPDHDTYTVTYENDADTVLVGVTFLQSLLARIHQKPDAHGTEEGWLGDPLGRLRNAAEGGSLDQTSRGYMPGTYERF